MTATALPPSLAQLQEQAWQVLTEFSVALASLVGCGAKAAREGLRRLPLAEAMMRRLVYLMALELDLPPEPPAPAATPDGREAARPAGASAPSNTMPRFRLLDPLPRDRAAPLLPDHLCPRITRMDEAARPAPLPEETPARPTMGRSPEVRFAYRVAALTDAFLHTERYARRMARWMARQKAARARRTQPLSRQLPPAVLTFPDDLFTDFLFTFHCEIMALVPPDTG